MSKNFQSFAGPFNSFLKTHFQVTEHLKFAKDICKKFPSFVNSFIFFLENKKYDCENDSKLDREKEEGNLNKTRLHLS